MTCPVCGVRREAFADDGSWFAHLAFELPVRRQVALPFPRPLSKRQLREQERLAQKRRDQLRRWKQREYNRRWRAQHPEESRAASARYAEAHPERVHAMQRENKRQWRALHPEESRLRVKLYIREHREEVAERRHQHWLNNRERLSQEKHDYYVAHPEKLKQRRQRDQRRYWRIRRDPVLWAQQLEENRMRHAQWRARWSPEKIAAEREKDARLAREKRRADPNFDHRDRLAREREAMILELHAQGLSHAQIAEKVGMHRSAVGVAFRRVTGAGTWQEYNDTRRTAALEYEHQVARLKASGLGLRKIAELTHRPYRSVKESSAMKAHKRNPGVCPCEQ